MAIHVGLMGFGRIGRNIFRILYGQDDIQVVAISDIVDPPALEYLLQFDTVHGRFPEPVTAKGDTLYVKGRQVKLVQGKEPKDVPWKDLGVDIVIEASARGRTRASLEDHLKQGAKRVVLTVPAHDPVDAVIVRGVNDEVLNAKHRIISAASITTNCAGLMLKILNNAFGVERAFMTTIHAYTNAQRLADVPHTDLRQCRAAAENIIPTETHVTEAIGEIIPELKGKFAGMAMNVPVPDGSNVDLVTETKQPVTVESVNEIFRSAAGSIYKGIVSYMDDPIVSSDVIGDSHSVVFDSLATMTLGDRMVKTLGWYDNGWGYAHRVVELVQRMSKFEGGAR
ncbi:MAG: type I glyceraldehyde-3-phosphate dehydrogenase [Pseudomonadota bacterium]